MRRADRLIKIVLFLRRRHRAVTARCIAEAFNVCTRTIYRDLQDLMDSGIPITGEAGVGYVIDKQYDLPPIMFDADELEAIALGISMVRQWTDDRFAAKAESAFEKIQAVLSTQMQGDLQQIATHSVSSRCKIPWSVSFSDVRECIRMRRKLDMAYVDVQQQTTDRTVRPLGLFFFSPVWLLACWCEKRNDFRNFRLDRIQAMQMHDASFADEADKNLQAYLAAHDQGCVSF